MILHFHVRGNNTPVAFQVFISGKLLQGMETKKRKRQHTFEKKKPAVCKGGYGICTDFPIFTCSGCGFSFCALHRPVAGCKMGNCKAVTHCGEAFPKCQNCKREYCATHLKLPHTSKWRHKDGYAGDALCQSKTCWFIASSLG